MGRGDRRSRRGKIWRNSYGNSRPKPRKNKPSFKKEEKPQTTEQQ